MSPRQPSSSALVERFLLSLSNHRSREFCRSCLKSFCGFLQQGRTGVLDLDQLISGATPETIRKFIKYLESNDYARSTVKGRIAAVRSFYHWLKTEGEIGEDPTRNVGIRWSEDEDLIATKEQIHALFGVLSSKSSVSLLYRAIFQIICSTGIDLNQLLQLDLGDVDDLENPTAIIERARGKSFSLDVRAGIALRDYLKQRPTVSSRALFVNGHDGRLSIASVHNKIGACRAAAQIEERLTINMLKRFHDQQYRRTTASGQLSLLI